MKCVEQDKNSSREYLLTNIHDQDSNIFIDTRLEEQHFSLRNSEESVCSKSKLECVNRIVLLIVSMLILVILFYFYIKTNEKSEFIENKLKIDEKSEIKNRIQRNILELFSSEELLNDDDLSLKDKFDLDEILDQMNFYNKKSSKMKSEESWQKVILLMNEYIHSQRFDESSNENRFETLVIFGDSFSDTGNNYNMSNFTWPIVPPYYKGRFCNDRNWVDRLTNVNILNYAYGSATTDNNFIQGYAKFYSIAVPGVRQQIDIYLNNTQIKQINFEKTLYIIWGGFNDLMFNSNVDPRSSINSLMKSVQYLIRIGVKHILIFNQPPFQSYPYFRRRHHQTYLSSFTFIENSFLETNVSLLRKKNLDLSISIFEIHKLIEEILSNHLPIFSNTIDRCWHVYNQSYVQIFCQNPREYLFLDDIHFTSPLHQFLAFHINRFMSKQFKLHSFQNYIFTP